MGNCGNQKRWRCPVGKAPYLFLCVPAGRPCRACGLGLGVTVVNHLALPQQEMSSIPPLFGSWSELPPPRTGAVEKARAPPVGAGGSFRIEIPRAEVWTESGLNAFPAANGSAISNFFRHGHAVCRITRAHFTDVADTDVALVLFAPGGDQNPLGGEEAYVFTSPENCTSLAELTAALPAHRAAWVREMAAGAPGRHEGDGVATPNARTGACGLNHLGALL